MRKNSRANKGQFFVIAALLVSVILVGGVISTYSLVRNPTVADSPDVLGAIGEMNGDIKSILDFTVGYYGSILQVTGNSSYAQGLTSSYLSSGLVNIARSHPQWNPSFSVTSDAVISTSWFMPHSSSMGQLSVTYSLGALGIEGITYKTSSALAVNTLASASGQAKISVMRDDSEPELGLTVDNFWFYNYSYSESTWKLVNPTNIVISANGIYTMNLPNGVGPNSYSVQIEDNRGIVVSAFYSPSSIESELGIPHYTYAFDWDSNGVSDIYDSLSTDNFVIEILQNGTLKWLGQPFEMDSTEPIPPISVKAFRVNATINDVTQQIPFQVEDWASDYMVPLGLSGNDTLFSDTNLLVFMVNNEVSEVTLWWDGNDTATPSPFAWQKNFSGDVSDTSDISLSNGHINLNVQITGETLLATSTAGSIRGDAEFLRVNGESPVFGAGTSVVIADGSVRIILQQEPEYSGGATNCPNFYAQLYFTLPLNTNYYTYTSRLIFVDSNPVLNRHLTNLNVVELTAFAGDALTENGTLGGYPVTDDSTGNYYNQSSSTQDHHWSEFISGSSGTGVMFRDVGSNLYNFDKIIDSDTGAIVVEQTGYPSYNRIIEVNPVELDSVDDFDDSLDVIWHGAIVTFSGEPIHPTSGDVGLWVMVENPPTVSMDEEVVTPPSGSVLEFFVDEKSDQDSSPDKGEHSDFSAQQAGPDSSVDVLTEATENDGGIEDYVDNNTSDVDASEDIGSHSSFSAQQAGPDSIFDTLTEENTAGSGDTTLLDDGFEGWPWDGNWNDISNNWNDDNYPVHGGSTSAWAYDGREGDLISDNLDASDASAIHVDFWFMKDDIEPGEFVVYYYNGNNYVQIDDLDDNGYDDHWIHFTATITDSQYFVSNFRIRFDANINDWRENVWVDDVLITKEVSTGDNYELDLEVQFTDVVDVLPNNELCIYAGTLGTEDLRVDYWNGGSWVNVASDLNDNSWNNFTISLSSSTVTVRFSGGSETGDSSTDQWQIDTVLLNSYGNASVEDYVEYNTSDVDVSEDIGSHSSFSAQQAGPDSIFDTLTEENTAGSGDTTLLDDGFEGWPWDGNWNDISNNWNDDNYPVHGGSTSAWAYDGREGDLISDNLDASDASAIHVDFWFMKDDIEPGEFVVYYYNGNNYVQIDDLDDNGYDDHWIHFTATITDSQYFVSNFRIRFDANINDWRENVWVDDVLITKEVSTGDNYELDLEVQFTDVITSLPNEHLAIYGGDMGDEDIAVDIWTGTAWETVFSDLTSGWNNVSINEWLTNSNFTIRFRGTTETVTQAQILGK